MPRCYFNYSVVEGIIVTRHVGNSQITSTKLVEAFFKGRKQANTTNALVAGLIIQHGWGYIQGNGSTILSEVVTFPIPFTSPPVIIPSFLAARPTASGNPTDTDSFSTAWGGYMGVYADKGNTTHFTVTLHANATHSNTFNFGYGWIAIGAA